MDTIDLCRDLTRTLPRCAAVVLAVAVPVLLAGCVVAPGDRRSPRIRRPVRVGPVAGEEQLSNGRHLGKPPQ